MRKFGARSSRYPICLRPMLQCCSLHSLRCGRAQHSHSKGAIVADLVEDHLWRCEESVLLYLHPPRHERRVRQRVMSNSAPGGRAKAEGVALPHGGP